MAGAPDSLDKPGRTVFRGDLSAPGPIPEAGIAAATALMRDGRLFRYGEDRGSLPEAALLEEEFAASMGMKYALGVNSGGCALFLALKAVGIEPGDKVLVNNFTLAPVPGAIAHAGAEAVLVEITEAYKIDLEDLDRKAAAAGAKVLMLSYMRGHIPDLDRVAEICRRRGLILVEDCAHTMGARWAGRLTGTCGQVGCFSTQTFKHVNSGEGGLLVTDDDDTAARAILHSGSYMLYEQHKARPPLEVFERHKYVTPNFSMRMSSLVAAVLRPQLGLLDQRIAKWRDSYARMAALFNRIEGIAVPSRPNAEEFVPSSIQFQVSGLNEARMEIFLRASDDRGVHVKWFGGREPVGFTSHYEHWRYLSDTAPLPRSRAVLDGLCDMRLPLSLSDQDCAIIAAVLAEAIAEAAGGGAP